MNKAWGMMWSTIDIPLDGRGTQLLEVHGAGATRFSATDWRGNINPFPAYVRGSRLCHSVLGITPASYSRGRRAATMHQQMCKPCWSGSVAADGSTPARRSARCGNGYQCHKILVHTARGACHLPYPFFPSVYRKAGALPNDTLAFFALPGDTALARPRQNTPITIITVLLRMMTACVCDTNKKYVKVCRLSAKITLVTIISCVSVAEALRRVFANKVVRSGHVGT